MRTSILSFVVLLLCMTTSSTQAQMDPHFSQYYAYPLWLNPALTGVIDADARVTGNYRDQWTGLSDGYKTAAVSADFRHSDKVAWGANIFNQKAGSAGYNYLSAYGTFGYQLSLSSDGFHKLSMGLQAGLINRRFDSGQLQMDDQYNPATGFDPGIPTSDIFSAASASVFDASTGLFYYDGRPSATVNFFAGISSAHLSGSKDRLTKDGLDSAVPRRHTVHGGARISATDFLDITPHFIYMRQRKSELKAAGLNLEFNLKPEYSLMLGGMYRVNDAAVGNVGLYMKNLVVGLSYDYTTSPMQNVARAGGGYELSITYLFTRSLSARSEKCPRL